MPVFLHNGKLHAFVHVPKCGGTTVERVLKDRFGPLGLLHDTYFATPQPQRWSRTSPQHIAWADMQHVIPEAMLDTIFAVVRHPLARFASTYNFNARNGHVPAGMGPEEWFEMGTGDLGRLPFLSDNHLRAMVDLVPERAQVFKLEDGLDPVVGWIDATFGVSGASDVEHANVAPASEDALLRRIDVPARLKARIEAHYSADYARFGYATDPDRPVTLTVPRPHKRTVASRIYTKLWARRVEHRFRRLESSMLMAVSRGPTGKPESRVS